MTEHRRAGTMMLFARRTFLVAGIYGLVVLLPMYFLEGRIGRDTPPPITHPEFFYGFLGVAITNGAADLASRRIVTCLDAMNARDGSWLTTAGLVLVRQNGEADRLRWHVYAAKADRHHLAAMTRVPRVHSES